MGEYDVLCAEEFEKWFNEHFEISEHQFGVYYAAKMSWKACQRYLSDRQKKRCGE